MARGKSNKKKRKSNSSSDEEPKKSLAEEVEYWRHRAIKQPQTKMEGRTKTSKKERSDHETINLQLLGVIMLRVKLWNLFIKEHHM